LTKKSVLLILFAIVLLTLAARYPLVEHERFQADSYFIHYLSASVVNDGYAKWTFNPLSYLGYYPLSYPSGVPFVLAEFSCMSGLSIESCILLSNMAMGVLLAVAVFCIAREFMSRSEYVLLAVLVASLSPRFVDTTYWVGSARGFMVVLITLSVFVLIRASTTRDLRLVAVGSLIVFGCFTIHHMAVLFLVMGIAYVLSSAVARRLNVSDSRHKKAVVIILSILYVAVLWVAFSGVDLFSNLIELSYQSEENIFQFEPKLVSTLLNILVSYGHQLGVISLFAVIYMLITVRRLKFDRKDVFVFALFLTFLPLIGNALYISLILMPYVAILGAKWFAMTFQRRSMVRAKVALLAAVIALSIVLPVWSTQEWDKLTYRSGDSVEVDYQVFNDAAYANFVGADEYAISNNDYLSLQIGVVSEVGFLKSGIPSVVNGDVDSSDIKTDVRWSSSNFPTNLYIWFRYDKDLYIYIAVSGLMTAGVGNVQDTGFANEFAISYFSEHSHILVVVDNHLQDEYVGLWGVSPAKLLGQLETATWADWETGVTHSLDCCLVYQSERSSVYLLDLNL
jgi:hypothetical protein